LGERDVWANYFLGDRRLGDKLGRYGDSKLDGWATCVKEEKLKTSDTIIRQMCAGVSREHNIEKYDQSISAGSL